ncbi:MAG: hypothetical protein IIC95_09495 [Chloroflexi bacterium]|nr:hypothetical protein [Chloroflexota bacterium]
MASPVQVTALEVEVKQIRGEIEALKREIAELKAAPPPPRNSRSQGHRP